jgi:hypothetical protein
MTKFKLKIYFHHFKILKYKSFRIILIDGSCRATLGVFGSGAPPCEAERSFIFLFD